MTDTIKDDFLVEKAKGGDSGAFRLLYERHRGAIFRFLYRLSGSAEVAEDITHDCFLNLIRGSGKSQVGAPASVRTQLYSTARTLAMEYFRNSGQEPFDWDLAKDEVVLGREQPLNRILDQRSASEVREAIASLPPLEREAFVFFEYEGLKLGEIATIVGTDLETLTARLERSRQQIRNTLASDPHSNR